MHPTQILVLSRTITPKEYLTEKTLESISKIRGESPRKNIPSKNVSARKTFVKKTEFKKKAESFDDAMRMKIVADLNKLTDKNYPVIVKEIQALYSRISNELKSNVLKLIVENSTKQHIYAKEYMRMYMDLTKDSPEERKMGESILQETVDTHEKIILTDITDGDSYDDFCEANKVKVSRIGLSIVIGESCNLGMIPPMVIGQHAMNLLQTMDKIRSTSNEENKVAVGNQTECVLRFFRTVAKTKISRDGFQKCISGFKDILDKEKVDKKLNPKARFALMDFIDDMTKMYAESKANVYVPKNVARN